MTSEKFQSEIQFLKDGNNILKDKNNLVWYRDANNNFSRVSDHNEFDKIMQYTYTVGEVKQIWDKLLNIKLSHKLEIEDCIRFHNGYYDYKGNLLEGDHNTVNSLNFDYVPNAKPKFSPDVCLFIKELITESGQNRHFLTIKGSPKTGKSYFIQKTLTDALNLKYRDIHIQHPQWTGDVDGADVLLQDEIEDGYHNVAVSKIKAYTGTTLDTMFVDKKSCPKTTVSVKGKLIVTCNNYMFSAAIDEAYLSRCIVWNTDECKTYTLQDVIEALCWALQHPEVKYTDDISLDYLKFLAETEGLSGTSKFLRMYNKQQEIYDKKLAGLYSELGGFTE